MQTQQDLKTETIQTPPEPFKSVGVDLFVAQCHNFDDILKEVSNDSEVRLCGHLFIGYDNIPMIALDGICYSLNRLKDLPTLEFNDKLLYVKIDPEHHQIIGTMGVYYIKLGYDLNVLRTGKQFVMLLNRILDLLFNSNFK